MCEKCGKPTLDTLINVFSEELCLDCWDDYLMTDRGKVEYFIGIVKEELPIEDYDADFLGHIAVCWNNYKSELNHASTMMAFYEAKAKELGIL
jgi:hypothetical protein